MALIDAKEAIGLLREGAEVVHQLLATGAIQQVEARKAAYQWLLKTVEREIAEEKKA